MRYHILHSIIRHLRLGFRARKMNGIVAMKDPEVRIVRLMNLNIIFVCAILFIAKSGNKAHFFNCEKNIEYVK